MSEYYPAGALNAKDAPWNRDDDEYECPGCGEPVPGEGDLCRACAREEAELERWERRHDE